MLDTELIAVTRVFSFSIAEQHTCINLHIKRLDGRMCCVREYLKLSFCICLKVDAALTTLLGFMEEDAKRRGDSFNIGF
jgi:hypothetical protein